MISIIIPAHNEASVLPACLSRLTQGFAPSDLEIIVVANACKDNTADVARQFAPIVRVIETQTPGKSNALNLGDAEAKAFPRFYLDADIRVEPDAIRAVAAVLESGKVLAAAPQIHFDLTHCPWSVRAFYDIWTQTPYIRQGMIGSGLYAMSKEGRARFEKFPPITADDGFARLVFAPQERLTLTGCNFTVNPPRSLSRLIRIKTRAYFGDIELKHNFPELQKNHGQAHGGTIKRLARQPSWWPALAVYVFVRLVTRVRGQWRWKFGNHKHWDRDETSRLTTGNSTNAPAAGSAPGSVPGSVSSPATQTAKV